MLDYNFHSKKKKKTLILNMNGKNWISNFGQLCTGLCTVQGAGMKI